jgi:hypothetical protein
MIEYSANDDPAVRCLTMQGSTDLINVAERKPTAESTSNLYFGGSQTHSRSTSNDPSTKQDKVRTFEENPSVGEFEFAPKEE